MDSLVRLSIIERSPLLLPLSGLKEISPRKGMKLRVVGGVASQIGPKEAILL